MKAFYGSRISENMTRTPEGFLICHNVPICRTGWQDYLGQELHLDNLYDKIIPVYRSPEEVFSPAAMASYEGKSVTDEHPREDVQPDNYSAYEKGHVTNIRQGAGDEPDLLLADLVIKDPVLISEIENGKREVSCGYRCNYVPLNEEGTQYQQEQIRGNHVAIVAKARGGDRIAIKDSALDEAIPPKKKERSKPMKIDKNTLVGKVLSAFSRDAEPEEVAEVAKLMTGGGADEEMLKPAAAEPSKTVDEGGNEALTALEAKIDGVSTNVNRLAEIIAGLVKSNGDAPKQVEEPKDALSALEEELQKADPVNEEAVTIPAEEMGDEAPELTGEDLPKNPLPGADSRTAVLGAIRAIKPVIASISNVQERQRATDALAKMFKENLASPTGPDGYAQIQKALINNHQAKDSKPDESNLGKDWASKYNPHYKKEAK